MSTELKVKPTHPVSDGRAERPRDSRAGMRNPLLWLNLVCLDAPVVAVLWQWLFGHSFGLQITAAARVALFLTAWLIYLADRFADALSLPVGSQQSLRQIFCSSHRRIWVGVLLVIAITDGIIVLGGIDHQLFRTGVVVGIAAIIYLVVNSATRAWRVLPVKE